MILNISILLATIALMELVAWASHKYLMHGPLWFLHKSHHVPHEGGFEWNDLFGIFFAVPSILLIYLGTHGYPPLLWIGIGMTAYGAVYFGFHDIVVHRRLPLKLLPNRGYIKRIIQAHHIHHAVRERDGAVSFGFLYAPPIKKLQEGLQKYRRATSDASTDSAEERAA